MVKFDRFGNRNYLMIDVVDAYKNVGIELD